MTIPEVIGGTSLNNPPTQPEQLNGSAEGVELPGNNAAVRDSVLGRLLQELSWVGAQIRDFHDGGLGFENVLTAEALTALDFLPRTDFLGAVLEAAHGAAAARTKAVAEIEQAEVTLFPEQLVLRPNAPTNQKLVVQPDGSVISTGSYVMIEAKRIRASTFQPEQLAREYVALMRDAQGRTPLLLLILGSEPPVAVRGHGHLEIAEAISLHLSSVLERTEDHDLDEASLGESVPEVVSWITWQELGRVVTKQRGIFCSDNPSVNATVSRLADSLTNSVARHS
jgi:hypothetical protein